jgi:hypothetical protein
MSEANWLHEPVGLRFTFMKRTKKSKPLTFEQGYVCAVATLLRQHGEETMAKDLLGCIAPDWASMDAYDKEILALHGLLPNDKFRQPSL